MNYLPLWFRMELTEQPSGCWTFDDAHNAYGYGAIKFAGKLRRAHRVAFHLATGFDLGSPLKVLYECDNPACCRPSQLFSGTQKDNAIDMYRKGRGMPASCKARGERQHSAVYTASQVLAMRSGGGAPRALALIYGGTPQAIRAILQGKTWRHLLP